jgi:hypothetical protein
MKIRELLATAAAALALSPSIATATIAAVPPIDTLLTASGDGPDKAKYGILSNSAHVPGSDATTFASILYSGGGMTETATASSVGGALIGQSESNGVFYFEVVGPDGTVPIDFSASATSNVTGPAGDSSDTVEVEFGTLAKLQAAACSPVSDCVGGGLPSAFSGSVHFDVSANKAYQVHVQAGCYAASNLILGGSTCGTMIDPMATIDPGFIDKGLYTLAFSPNVAGPVPEPASWAVMLIGLFGIGALCRTGRRTVRA